MRKMKEGMEANHKKRAGGPVKRASNKILNNGSTRGTNDAVPDLSMPSPMIEFLMRIRPGQRGVQCEDKDRDKEK